MSLLDHTSVKLRMVLTFVFIALLLVVFGVASLREMRVLGDLTQTLYEHPLQVSNAALKAQGGVVRMHRDMKDVTLAENEIERMDAIRRVQLEEQRVYAELDIVREFILGAEGLALEVDARAAFAAWSPIRQRVQALIHESSRREAVRITKEEGAAHVQLLEQKMGALTAYARNKADGFMANARQVEEDITTNTSYGLAALILLLFLVSALVIHHFLGRLTTLQSSVAKITATGDLEFVQAHGNNEISQLASSFNELIASLKRQFWLREGLNSLNTELAAAENKLDLAERAVRFASRHLDACAGAIYTRDDASASSIMQASYALVERTHLANRFVDGEGVVGQVAIERKPILLTQISPDDAVMQSGTVAATPMAIYAVLVLYNGTLMGVLEVASLTDFDGLKREFVDAASAIVGTALHARQQRERIDALFAESQSSNAELEANRMALEATNQELFSRNETLREQSEELQVQTNELQQLAQELVEQKRELEVKRLQVEEADRLKSEFLSNMSHELRTPLNSILALSQLMLTKGTGKDTAKEAEYLSVVERNGRKLLALINEILDLSKIESGRMDLYVSTFSLEDVLHDILDTMAPLATEKGLILTPHIEFHGAITSDREKVQQILLNLVSNAVKFTDAGGVTIRVYEAPEAINIVVADTGIGMEPDGVEQIFDAFRQLDGSTSRRHEGTGLGLAICKKLAALLGGDLTVHTIVGEGSTFTLVLPRTQHAQPAQERSVAAATAHLPAAVAPAGERTVLVVDDNREARQLIRGYLAQAGYEVVEAENGKQALEVAKRLPLFAVTLDIVMPEMDGWEVLRQFKLNPAIRDIPIVIISMSDDKTTGVALGASGYVVKPVDRIRLMTELKRVEQGTVVKTVLVVEDDDTMRGYIASVLQEAGYTVQEAANGIDAMELLSASSAHRTRPDAMLLDLMLPGMDGFQILEQVRQDPALQRLPVLVVTAKDLTASERATLAERSKNIIQKGEMGLEALLARIADELQTISTRRPRTECGSSPRSVLVVEDNAIAIIQITAAMEELGFDVRHAADGREALDDVASQVPDLIILDLMMPNVDGFAVLDALRADPGTAGLPVVILTAKELSAEDKARLSDNNISQFIRKGSVDREQLQRVAVNALGAPGMDAMKAAIPPQEVHAHFTPLQEAHGTVLIVEDNEDNLVTIKAVLEDFGGSLLVAKDGESAVTMAASHQPDVILMDINLPGMSGLEATRTIKAAPQTSHTPIIALTARAMASDRDEIFLAGCNDLITKPFDPNKLRKALGHWLQAGRGAR